MGRDHASRRSKRPLFAYYMRPLQMFHWNPLSFEKVKNLKSMKYIYAVYDSVPEYLFISFGNILE